VMTINSHKCIILQYFSKLLGWMETKLEKIHHLQRIMVNFYFANNPNPYLLIDVSRNYRCLRRPCTAVFQNYRVSLR